MKKLVVLVAVVLLNLTSTYACDEHGKTGFLPENNLNIPVGLKAVGGINEAQFNRVMDKMQKLFSKYVEARGPKFVIERKWADGTVNAYAHQQTLGAYTIVMFGGLARHNTITEDGMALVACHELGHHLGGAPRKTTSLWASNEGQADYWGTMKCLSHYFADEDNQTIVKNMQVPAAVVNKCQSLFANANEQAICERTAMAGFSVGRLFNALSGDKLPVSFTTPDKSIVQTTFDAHPASQCRLDTYFSASLCDHKSMDELVSNTDPNQAVCTTKNGDNEGVRPLCWFKPN